MLTNGLNKCIKLFQNTVPLSTYNKLAGNDKIRRSKVISLDKIPEKLQGVILDWSGTTVDKYVVAPAKVFVDVFEKHKVPISFDEARKPMGLRKDLHIKEILKDDNVKKRWENIYNKSPTEEDADRLFEDFVPMQLNCLGDYTQLLPGTASTVDKLRNEYGLKIGCTTGFTRVMVDVLLEDAEKQGFRPDVNVAGDEVENGGRPSPNMVFKNMDLMNIYPPQAILKVDDTVGGVGEGLNAGAWTCGVSRYSNYMDFDEPDDDLKISKEELDKRHEKSRQILMDSGAHYVVDTINELPAVIDDINNILYRKRT